MSRTPLEAPIQDEPPADDAVTEYDRRHFVTYARLLDAEADGTAEWEEIARIVLRLDPDRDPVRARSVYDAHLDRALWMARSGYRHLIPGGREGNA